MPSLPYNLEPPGASCRVESPTSPLTCQAGSSNATSSPAEQFIPYRLDGGQTPILPGEKMYLRSVQTGMYCRVLTAANSSSQVLCDQPTPATASQLTFTGMGLGAGSSPFLNPEDGSPVYFGNASQGLGTPVVFKPVVFPQLPSITSGTAYNLDAGGNCRVESVDGYVYCPKGNSTSGTSQPEQFVVFSAGQIAGATIAAGSSTIIKSIKTGLFCRAVTLENGQRQIKCDVADAAQASPFMYTGTGFSFQVRTVRCWWWWWSWCGSSCCRRVPDRSELTNGPHASRRANRSPTLAPTSRWSSAAPGRRQW